MRQILGTVLTIAAVFGTAAADAGEVYVGLSGGLNLAGDMDIEGTGIDSSADFGAGAGAAAALGYGYGNGFRTELEVGWRRNDVDDVSGTGASGDVSAFSGMLNGFYDVDTGTGFTPYLGAGAGVARVAADGVSPVSGTRVDDNDIALAVQGIAGLAYRLDEQWALTADYQYFTTPNLEYRTDSGVDVDGDYAAHTFRVGLRLSFGGSAQMAEPEPESPLKMTADAPENGHAPAAAVPGEPEPADDPVQGPNRFIAFFDWDKAILTPVGRDVVRRAAEQAKAGKPVRIVATGHADRSGPEPYNLKLSMHRADAVKAELVRHGLEVGQIDIAYKGESEPRVETPDGQREPENRRVEIVFP